MADSRAASERFAGAMDNLILLADTMQQASAVLADEDGDAPKASTSFLSAIALGSVVRIFFAFFPFRSENALYF